MTAYPPLPPPPTSDLGAAQAAVELTRANDALRQENAILRAAVDRLKVAVSDTTKALREQRPIPAVLVPTPSSVRRAVATAASRPEGGDQIPDHGSAVAALVQTAYKLDTVTQSLVNTRRSNDLLRRSLDHIVDTLRETADRIQAAAKLIDETEMSGISSEPPNGMAYTVAWDVPPDPQGVSENHVQVPATAAQTVDAMIRWGWSSDAVRLLCRAVPGLSLRQAAQIVRFRAQVLKTPSDSKSRDIDTDTIDLERP